MGYPSHDCIGLRRHLDGRSEVRRDHLTEILNWKMVRHVDPRLQTPEERSKVNLNIYFQTKTHTEVSARQKLVSRACVSWHECWLWYVLKRAGNFPECCAGKGRI